MNNINYNDVEVKADVLSFDTSDIF